MLSPDVPEFVPREFQDREVPSNIGSSVAEHVNVESSVGFHPVPSYPLYHYSLPPHCSPERVLNDGGGNWGNLAIHSQPWEERTPVCNRYGSHQNPYKPNNAADGSWRNSSNDTWKNSSSNNWRPASNGNRNSNRYSRDENSRRGITKKKTTGRSASDDTSQEVKQIGTEKKSQVHSTDDMSQGKGIVLPLNNKSNPSTVEQFKAGASASTAIIQDAKQQSKQVSVVKKRDTFQEGRQVPQAEDAVKERRQVTNQKEVDLQVIAGSVNYDRGKVHSHGKGDWPGFTMQGKYKDEVSYKKILSRKKEDNILTEKLQPTINLIPTQSDAQWPSLSPAHHQNPVDKSYDNVWVKKDNHLESSKWPRPSPEITTLTTASSLDSQEINFLDRKKGNKGKSRQGKQLVTNDKTFVESEATQIKDSQQSRERFKHADDTWFKDSHQLKERVRQTKGTQFKDSHESKERVRQSEGTRFNDSRESKERVRQTEGTRFNDSHESKERVRQTKGTQFKDLHQSKERVRQTEGTRFNDSHESKERFRQTEGTRFNDSHELKERVRQTKGTQFKDLHQSKERFRQTEGTRFNDSHESKERFRQTEGTRFKESHQSKDRVRQTEHWKPSKALYCEENMNLIKDENVTNKSRKVKPLKEWHKNYDSEKTDDERFEKREKGTSKDEVRYRNNHDRSDRLQRRLSQPSVNEKDVKITKNTKFESEEYNSAKEEDSEWQVKTKKKIKVKEPQEDDSSKSLRYSKSRNREKGIENRESLQSNYNKTRKYNDSRDACVDSRNKKKGGADDTGSLVSEKKGGVMAKNRAHMKTDFVKNGQGDNKQNQTFSRETFNSSRSNESSKHSGTVSRNTHSGPSGTKDRQNLRKSAVSEEEKTDVEDEATRALNIERKAKKKEDKMRKRESKVKRAQALMVADTKVTMVSKDVIDLMYRGSNQKKKKSKVSEEEYYLDDKSFQYTVEEYPTLMKDNSRVTTVSETFVESVLDSISDEEAHLQFSSTEYPSLTDREITRGRKPEDISTKSRVLGSDSSNVNRKESDVQERYGAFTTDIRVVKNKDTIVPLASQSAVPSYSRALLASPRKKVVPKSAPEVVPQKIMTAKKKVKSKDGITFDIMAAVTKKKVKKKDRNGVDLLAVLNRKPKTRDCIELDLSAAAATRKNRIKSRDVLLTALDPKFLEKTKSETSAKRGTKGDSSIIKPGKSKRTTKLRSEVVVKRGKQQEGQRKKKLSTLKKAMKRARLMEVETLLSVMQEAKKLQENLIATSDGTCASSDSALKQIEPIEETLTSSKPLESNAIDDIMEMRNISDGTHTVSLNGSENILTSDCVNEIAQNCDSRTKVVCDKDNKDLINMNLKGSADVPSEISKKEETKTEDQNSSVCQKEETKTEDQNSSVCQKEETKTEDQNSSVCPSETVSNVVDPEYSKKCQNMAEELKQLWNPVHKKTFREYCNHMVTPEVDLAAKELIRTLVRFQERQFQRDPVKARIRRRYVCGLKSTTKAMGKLSCVIAAPNIERCKGPGALDEVVEKMLGQAEKHGVPVIFALTCKRIGYLCLKASAVSCIGIINYHGAQDIFHKLMEMIPEAQKQYQQLIAGGSRTLPIGDGESSDEESAPLTQGITNELTVSNATLSPDISKGNTAESDSLVASTNVREVIASTFTVLKKSDKTSFPLLQETSGDMAAVTTIPGKNKGKSESVPQNTREEVIAYTVAILSGETESDPLIPLAKDNGEETINSTLVDITGETEE